MSKLSKNTHKKVKTIEEAKRALGLDKEQKEQLQAFRPQGKTKQTIVYVPMKEVVIPKDEKNVKESKEIQGYTNKQLQRIMFMSEFECIKFLRKQPDKVKSYAKKVEKITIYQ